MELRTLRYFLAISQEETISAAAESLHVTQPTLSRQMQELEDELGKTLFIRGKRKILLTEEGMFLRMRAREILSLVDKTEAELVMPEDDVAGEVCIGSGETDTMRIVVRAARKLREAYPRITFRIFSGNGEDVAERLERGIIDFGIFVEPFDLSRFDYVRLPVKETWGLLMKAESPLARQNAIHPEDIVPLPLIMSRQSMVQNMLSGWLGGRKEQLNIVSTYNLLYNASLMVEEGMGYALCLDGIISTSGERPLCFRPLEPKLEAGLSMAWKKYQVFSRSADLFLKYLKAEIRGMEMLACNDKKIF